VSTAQGHFLNNTPTGGIWHSLNRLVVALILVVVALIIGVRFLPVLSDRRAQLAWLQQLTSEVEHEKRLYDQNVLHEEHLRSDSEYAALIARDRLGLAAPGETIYTFPRSDRDAGAARRER
jgi:cell division protein FtsB